MIGKPYLNTHNYQLRTVKISLVTFYSFGSLVTLRKEYTYTITYLA